MRIDSHQHFWRYRPDEFAWIDPSAPIARDFGPADLAPLLDNAGLDASIVVQARQSDAETDWLLELTEADNRIAAVVGWVDLRSDRLEERLHSLTNAAKLKGFRHVLQDEPDDRFMLQPDFIRGVQAILAHGYVYDVLVFERQLRHLPALLDACGDGRFVLDHLGKPRIADGHVKPWAAALRQAADYPNVWCKLSGMVTEASLESWSAADLTPYLDVAFDAFGPERLMFGSDWPVCLLAGEYSEVYGVVADYVRRQFPQAESMLFGGTAAAVYNL